MTMSILVLLVVLCVIGLVIVGAGAIIYAALNDRKNDGPGR